MTLNPKEEAEEIIQETFDKILSQMDWTDGIYRKFGNSEQKMEVLQEGLWDYLEKQFHKALEKREQEISELKQEVERLKVDPQERPLFLKEIEDLKRELEGVKSDYEIRGKYLATMNDNFYLAELKIKFLEAKLGVAKEALEHILEYWNKDTNEKAMQDALEEIEFTVKEALTKLGENNG